MVKQKAALEDIKPYSTDKYPKHYKLKLDSNENAYGAPVEVVNAIKELGCEQISRYPYYGELIDKAAQKFGVSEDEILLTNGADEGLSVVISAFLDNNEELICFMPTFSMPLLYARCAGGKIRGVDYYTKWVFDADKLIEQVNNNTKIIYISSPNNPTGELASIDDIEKILQKFPDIALILDVTYITFSQNPPDYFSLINKYDNIFIVKSFSKDFALAGLRLGVILSQSQNINICKKVISPYSVNNAAVCAGIAVLNNSNYEKNIKEQICSTRNILYEGLLERGFKPYRSEANFILCDFGQCRDFIFWKLCSNGIITKRFTAPKMLENCLRISVPRYEDLNFFFNALKTKDMIVFDLDGVVFDVSGSYRLAIKETFKYFCKKDISDNEIQAAKELGGLNCDWELTKYLLEKHGVSVGLDEVINVFQNMFFNPNNNASKGLIDNEKLLINPQTFEKMSQKYDFCAFTGRPREEAYYSLEKFGILKYFCKIISRDDVENDRQKPHPEGLNRIKHETIYDKIYYFGDTTDDVYAAVASLTPVFGVAEKDSNSAKILLEAGAKDIIDDISKIDEFLELREKVYAND